MNIESLSVGNAAGTIKTMLEVERACGRNAMTAITVGSITLSARKGNTPDLGGGRVYYYDPNGHWSLNSLGMPNMGLAEYLKQLPEMVRRAHAAGKELRVSVAGETPGEYALMTKECYACGVDRVELNLGCPNIWGTDGHQKPIPSYKPELTQKILLKVRAQLPQGKKVDVKISPVEDTFLLRKLAEIFADVGCVKNVVGVNTIPNQDRHGHDGNYALSFNGGNHLGGLAGSAICEESVRVHRQLRSYLPVEVGYIPVGGISLGITVHRHLKIGAIGFQSGTGYYEEGPSVFTPILQQLAELVEQPA
ncbi:MAG TPA: dihydroorotate dehydrogenase [Candidatus Paceibacterota bacterium]|nr:dihydroorotate dehydrogenase [Candidatus Paceibacterota bacterium]